MLLQEDCGVYVAAERLGLMWLQEDSLVDVVAETRL